MTALSKRMRTKFQMAVPLFTNCLALHSSLHLYLYRFLKPIFLQIYTKYLLNIKLKRKKTESKTYLNLYYVVPSTGKQKCKNKNIVTLLGNFYTAIITKLCNVTIPKNNTNNTMQQQLCLKILLITHLLNYLVLYCNQIITLNSYYKQVLYIFSLLQFMQLFVMTRSVVR